MTRILIAALVLFSSLAFGQSSAEPEHAPTTEQCNADARMWVNVLADQIRNEHQSQTVDFATEADQTDLGEWIKRWLELRTCVELQTDTKESWASVAKAGIERHIFSDRFLRYVTSSPSRRTDYRKWEAAEQAKARQKTARQE
ncbi:MAG TPA: hypothetical protein VFO39_02155 [Candidatus Sulfotelmatobacter sp.]|nr:hypothetical protein [Candidatus Sulfotelmatobacter sp.]